VYLVPKTPLMYGSSDGTSWLRPQRGSRLMLMLGDQQSSPTCGYLAHPLQATRGSGATAQKRGEKKGKGEEGGKGLEPTTGGS